MKVAELIEKLQEYPKDANIKVFMYRKDHLIRNGIIEIENENITQWGEKDHVQIQVNMPKNT